QIPTGRCETIIPGSTKTGERALAIVPATLQERFIKQRKWKTMNLTTRYLGMTLRTPLVPSASPLSENIDNIKRMEDAGAAAVVLHSLFEEQIRQERNELIHHLAFGTESNPEAQTYFPEPLEFHIGPDAYLEHLANAKQAVDIPIIASLN